MAPVASSRSIVLVVVLVVMMVVVASAGAAPSSSSRERIVVLPAASDVAAETIRSLLGLHLHGRGQRHPLVRAIVRNATLARRKHPDLGHQGVQLVEADLNDVTSELFIGAHRVLFVPVDGVTNVTAMNVAVVRAAEEAGVHHVVRLSALGAGQHEGHGWLHELHAVGDALLRQAKVPAYTVLRSASWFQNVRHAPGHPHSPLPDGRLVSTLSLETNVPVVDATDVAMAAATVLTQDATRHANRTYDLLTQSITLRRLSHTLHNLLDHDVPVQTLDSVQEYAAYLSSLRVPPSRATMLDDLCVAAAAFGSGEQNADNSQLRELLGRPPITLDAYLARHRGSLVIGIRRHKDRLHHDEL